MAAVVLCASCSRPTARTDETALTQHRNLGKAFYENPTTKQEAVDQFRAAVKIAPNSLRDKLNLGLALLRAGEEREAVKLLEEVQSQDPSLSHTWFNLGIYYKHQGDASRATRQFEGMIERVPAEAVPHFQLGLLYRQQHREADAKAQFEKAAELDPQFAAARFQLYNVYRSEGNRAKMNFYLADFQRVQALQKTWVIPEDAEWCDYAEIYDPRETRAMEDLSPEPPSNPNWILIDSTGNGQADRLVWSAKGVELFLRGEQLAKETGLETLTGVIGVAPGDFDNDGLMDLCVLLPAGPQLYRNSGGKFVRQQASLPARRFDAAVWMDYDHDYDLDVVLLGSKPALMRNQGAAGWADRTGDLPFVQANGQITRAEKLRVMPDSKAFDLAVFYSDRPAVLYRDRLGGRYSIEALLEQTPVSPTLIDADFLRNQGASRRHWIRVQLKGVRSLKLAQDALVEIKAGNLYARQFYSGVPLLFDTGDNSLIDVVRITWPNGLIQNEVRQAADQTHLFTEAQRLSGSCPMIWCWNGHDFEFITDVLGVAPLGARDGDGSFFPVDHQEFIQIPGSSLRAREGKYDVAITEELSEVSYLDQVQLYAVDHPIGTEIFTNERFKSPPYPDFRLFNVNHRIYPRSARDSHGENVLPLLTVKDQRYPNHFERSETGVADLHSLDLDFGSASPSGKSVLLMNGWVDWPDGSTFRRASQESKSGLIMPYLQVQDASGAWRTVDPDMGMPAGKPKTIAVPIEFLSASRKVRIVTNLCVYWDEIFLSEETSDGGLQIDPIPMDSADLHFRGFSESRIHPLRQQPDTFFYGSVSPASFWNPTSGLYTRYGAVTELLKDLDDRLVVMGSGDEVRLQFRAGPPPGPGSTRDFLLKVDGWAKDRDPNTAYSESVEPLPFHGMSRYPYPAGEHYPRDAVHDGYQRTYNTRPAQVLLAPLTRN